MPGNEAEDRIYNVYDLDNSSQNQHISRAVGGNWPVLDYNHWVGNGGTPNLNLNNHTLERLEPAKGHNVESLRMSLNQNYTQWTPGSEYSRSLTIKNPLNTNETFCVQPNQNQQGIYGESTCDQQILSSRAFSVFKSQPDNECADSPTLTTNSERSEITEASVDYNFHRGQQQFVRDREVNVPKPQKMQQPGYNDMQMLQQHMMFKQLQEFQRQQQLGDLRQQNPLNQFPVTTRQVAGAPFSPLINGTPVDAQNMLMNWMQQGAAPGVSNKVIFPQEHGQAMLSMGLTQQIDASLYGTPVSNTRGNMSQYPHFQGMPHNSVNMMAKAGGQAPKSSGFGSPSSGDQHAVSDFVSVPKQELEMKNNARQLPIRGVNSGNFSGNLQERKEPHVNTSTKEFNMKPEQGSSQGLVPLDPMEAKILYNMDENIWDAFGSRPETGAVGVGNTSEHPDSSYSFSSIQGGTWSALMQSAVAEASSSDTGIKEEWSGSTFQNTEQSTDNHISNFVDSERQQTSWVDNNLKSGSSFSSKPLSMVTDPRTSSSFPGFHQSGMQLLTKQREDYCNDSSRESAVNYNPQKPAIQGGEKDPRFIHWTGQMFEHSQSATKHESQEKQQNRQQRENSNDSLKDLNSHDKGHREQLKFFDNFSSSPMNPDKGSAPNFQGSPRASEEVPSRGDHGSNASTSFHGSVLPEGSNISSQTSEHMLELLHKVDQSKDGADSRDTSIAQMHSQSSPSQGFGLRLAPPYQKLANPNSILSPARSSLATNDLNSRQVKAELEEKSQAWHAHPSSFNSSSPSHEVAQRTHWDNRSGSPGPTSLSRYANMQGNSAVSFSPNRPEARSQLQIRPSGLPVTSDSFQASLPGSTSRFSPFNQVPSQDTSQQINSYSASQPFPVLDTMPMSHHSNLSSMAQQGQNSARPYYVWRNVPIQKQPFSSLSSSMESPNNNMSTTSWAPHVPVEQNSVEEGNKSSEVSTSSNLQGYDHMEELTGKEMLQQHISSNILDTSSGGTGQGQENISYLTGLNSGHLGSHVPQQHVDKVRHTDIFSQASQRNLESFSHSRNDHHNYALVQQVQAMNNPDNGFDVQRAAALGGQQLHDNISRFRHLVDGRLNTTSQPNSFPSGDAQVVSPSAEASSQAAVHSRSPQEIAAVGYNDSQPQSSSKNVISNPTEHGHVNLQMANSWFKQYGALRNGQMSPMFDPRPAKAAASQFYLGKPSQNLHMQSSLKWVDGADAGQDGADAAATMLESQQVSSPYTNQVAIMRPKKRKIMTLELRPWHKEVMQDSGRLQNLSVAEQDWAQATNRLTEKVEDEVALIEDVRPIRRSKRRLVLTTQLVQQLFHPAPASIFSADAAGNYGIISYFISRLSLGDSCSFVHSSVKDFLAPLSNSNLNSENPKYAERNAQQILEVMNNLSDRTKQLENDFHRLDKTASVAIIRAEVLELERFTVINRFAKFHVRGQMDVSGSSLTGGVLQRHVIAIPMPQNLPEGVQCLSL
ncbi:dentin sialophosphoprotein-related [Euphorbia peplus]|nr:dentin sialophosphoprotein-related [Euphorbia peplus]